MRRLFTALSAIGVFTAASLNASTHPEEGQWAISADFLYLSPTVDDTHFVIVAPVTSTYPRGPREGFDCQYQPAFRLGATFAFCECDRELQLHYSHLQATQSRSIGGSFLWAAVGRPDYSSAFENYAGSATGNLNYNYNSADVTLSQAFFCCHGLDLHFLAGVEFAAFHFNEHYTNTITAGPTLGSVTQTAKTWGIGPHIGLEMEYEVLSCSETCPGTLTFAMRSTAGLLASKSSATNKNILTGNTILDVSESDVCRLIPAMHLKASLGYTVDCGCANVFLELGYQLSSYVRGISRMGFVDDVADSLNSSQFLNFDLRGPYISATVTF